MTSVGTDHDSLEGAVAIVTGGYTGVDLETTRALAAAGAMVVVPARTSTRERRPSVESYLRRVE
jgi:NAD(P)-dependent dehydrogenase (short-subunit alcohol dehydrogenase family)